LGRNRLDPKIVAALTKIFERGDLRMHRSATVTEADLAQTETKPEAAIAGD
jgi:hypothetical protein